MKRILTLLLVLTICLGNTACVSKENNPLEDSPEVLASIRTSDEAGGIYDPALKERKENIILKLDGEIPYSEVLVSSKAKLLSLTITIEGSDKMTEFGNFIITAKQAFEMEFSEDEQGSLLVELKDDQGSDIMAFKAAPLGEYGGEDYGILRDTRGEVPKYTELRRLEDLFRIFPAAAEYQSKRTVPEGKKGELYVCIFG